uniref:Transmembrane protein n=1 Tax=Haemonchus contortus TaxID=6289 RepID=A0A7I4Y1V1_HAECO
MRHGVVHAKLWDRNSRKWQTRTHRWFSSKSTLMKVKISCHALKSKSCRRSSLCAKEHRLTLLKEVLKMISVGNSNNTSDQRDLSETVIVHTLSLGWFGVIMAMFKMCIDCTISSRN